MGVLELLAAVVLAFWVGLALDRRRWWPSGQVLPAAADSSDESVTAVVPARDEAESVPRSMPALLTQKALARVVLVDDGSTDGTAALALRAAAAVGATNRLRIVSGRPPPPGWTGKLNALQCGLESLDAGSPDAASPPPQGWVLFTDADIEHPPSSVARLLARARSGDYDLVSIMARLRADTFWERLLVPPFVYFFQQMYPFRRVADRRSRVAAAAGGCVLLRRAALERAGGLEAMKGAIIDDVTLGRRIKGAGGSTWLGIEPGMVSIRGYSSLGGIIDMVARTAFTELRHRYSLVLLTWVALGLFYVAPPVLAGAGFALGETPAGALALAAWIVQAATLAPVVRHQRVPLVYALTLPAAAFLYAWMTTVSAWRHLRGQGVRWRGRVHE